ncbi:MAG: hypothetical protein L3J12_07840 [Spirochaetales bacterium]|nr:hypothetical protein [Spirochaetales bacterium]
MNCLVIACFIFILPLFAFEIEEMEFIDQPIKDILFTLARITGNSIIADSTVSGKGSYYFIDTDLETALKQFLSVYDLSFSKSDGVYYVSRVIVELEKESNKLTLYGKDVKPGLLIEKIGKVIGKTILYDELPEELISVNVIDMGVEEVLKMIMYRFEEYEIELYPNYFYIKKTGLLNKTTLIENNSMIKMENNLYSISAPSIRLSDALKQLFKESGNEFSLMKRGDTVLESLFFKNKTFDEMLRLLLERSDGDYTVRESVYYIFDISRNEIMKKFDYLEYIKLESIPVELLPALFPAGLAGSSVFKIDRENNAIILSGSSEETAPVRDFIHKMEEEYGNKVISELDLSFLTVEELLKLLPLRMKNLEIRRTGDPGKIIIEASRELTDNFISYVKLLDSSSESEVVPLKYIRSDKLLKNLPPSVSEENILKSNDPNTVFFKGSDERLERFLSDLEHIDIPVPQIRYELLVIQYQESRNKEFSLNFGNEILNEGAQTTILGSLGKVINLNLDIVSTFGYQFAVDLNAKLGESDAMDFVGRL